MGGEVERIKEAMGATIDITFDCAGFSKTMSTALGATSSGGKVCLVGMGHIEMTVPLAPAAVRYFLTRSYFIHCVTLLYTDCTVQLKMTNIFQ